MKTIDELNDEIRARVNAEMPRPAGGFESEEHLAEFRMKQDARFFELCRESADAENRIREAAPELLEALEMALESLDAVGVEREWDCRVKIRAVIAKARGGAA